MVAETGYDSVALGVAIVAFLASAGCLILSVVMWHRSRRRGP